MKINNLFKFKTPVKYYGVPQFNGARIFTLGFFALAFFVFGLGFGKDASAATYYVDSSITDTNVASATPDFTNYNHETYSTNTGTDSVFKTIADINLKSFSAGDQIYFRKGQAWIEQLIFPSSGSNGNPIIVGSFGTGNLPIINGSGNNYGIRVNAKNYLEFQNLDIQGGTTYGIRIQSSTGVNLTNVTIIGGNFSLYIDEGSTVVIDQCLIRDSVVNSTVSVSGTGANNVTIKNTQIENSNESGITIGGAGAHDLNVYSTTIYGARHSGVKNNGGSSTVSLKNCNVVSTILDLSSAYPVWNTSTGSITYDHCLIQPSYVDKSKISNGTDAGNNTYESPLFYTTRRPGVISIVIDDSGVNFENWKTLATEAEERGFYITSVVETRPAIGNFTTEDWAEMQLYIDRGHEIGSHSRHHVALDSLNSLAIQYVGAGSTCSMNISSSILSTTVTGGPGGENLSIDLTAGSYDDLMELKNYIDGLSGYTCSFANSNTTHTSSSNLADISSQDIKTSAYTALFDETRYHADEITSSKTDLESNLINYTAKSFSYPYGNFSTNAKTAIKNAGFLGARATGNGTGYKMSSMDIYQIKAYDPETVFGSSNIARNVYANLDAIAFDGQLYVLVGHSFAGNYSLENWQTALDAIKTYTDQYPGRVMVKTLGKAMEYVRDNGSSIDGGVTWTRSFNDESNLNLQSISPAIDAGTSVGLTSDYAGNPIYGTPDIGAYEYQPPHVIGTDKIDIGAGARIYGDGKFRDKETTNSNLADLSITPESGNFQTYNVDEVRPEWMDIKNVTWEDTKEWTESSSVSSLTNTLHEVGDLEANKYYNVSVDDTLGLNIVGTNCTAGICKSDSNGKIAFTYVGTYSEHTFKVEAGDNSNPTLTNNTNNKFSTDTASLNLILTTDENSTCRYSNNSATTFDNATVFTTTGETSHSVELTNLTSGNYLYYAICRDSNNNESSYTLTFEIAPEEAKEKTSSPIIKTSQGKEKIKSGNVIYSDEKEIKLQGDDLKLAGGTIKIYRNSKHIKTIPVDSNGKWNGKIKLSSDFSGYLKVKQYNQYGTLINEKKTKVKVDNEKPEITSFPKRFTPFSKGSTINWQASDNQKVDKYKIYLGGNIYKTKANSFTIPTKAELGLQYLRIRAYDKAGNSNYKETFVLVR